MHISLLFVMSEIGCGSGGLSYLLAKDFKGVVGIDHSHADVKFASSLRDGSVDASSIDCSDIDLPVNQKNVEFRNSDPMSVPAELHGFDVVVISDVLDKVSSPNSVLGRLGLCDVYRLVVSSISNYLSLPSVICLFLFSCRWWSRIGPGWGPPGRAVCVSME